MRLRSAIMVLMFGVIGSSCQDSDKEILVDCWVISDINYTDSARPLTTNFLCFMEDGSCNVPAIPGEWKPNDTWTCTDSTLTIKTASPIFNHEYRYVIDKTDLRCTLTLYSSERTIKCVQLLPE